MPAEGSLESVQRTGTRVMSCGASIVLVGDEDLDRAVRRLDELEALWSRFLPTSDVARLNRSGGQPVAVAAETVDLVARMIDGWALTDGCFDPTIVGALVVAGYGVSRTDPERTVVLSDEVGPLGSVEGIIIDRERNQILLPIGTAIDPGGVGKGLAADIVVGELLDRGADGALVEIGGDLRVAGRAPEDRGWCVAVDDRGSRRPLLLAEGGVATSSIRNRRWESGGRTHHHLIDPRTGTPSGNGVVQCTVVAGTAADAEVQTKVGFVLEPAAAIEHWERWGLAAQLETDDGRMLTTPAWRRFCAAREASPEAPTVGSRRTRRGTRR